MDKLIILTVVGGLIGWMTNVIAIKLLFRPFNPIKIPLTPFVIHGLIPKRKKDIAKNIGDTVENELLSIEDIIDRFIENENMDDIIAEVKTRIIKIVDEKMPAMVPSMFKPMIFKQVEEAVDENAQSIIVELSERVVEKAAHKVSLALIVEEKINEFDFEHLERIILSIAKKELKHIELLGGVLGVTIGFVQGLIILSLG